MENPVLPEKPKIQVERLHDQYSDIEQQRESYTVGLWVFLASEVMFFGVLFIGYSINRILYADGFSVAGQVPNKLMGAVNTLVLLTSSLTVALAVRAATLRARKPTISFLLVTAVLGCVFLAIKFTAWWIEIQQGHLPGPGFVWHTPGASAKEAELFFYLYFALTGVHALHLSIAVIAVVTIAVLYAFRHPSVRDAASPVELVGLYWHFVDIVWVFLFPMFYLIPPPR